MPAPVAVSKTYCRAGLMPLLADKESNRWVCWSEEDLEFDEDSFRIAQEEEGKKRIERIREVKRGLEGWRGWRVDLVDVRAGGLGGGAATGPMFEV
ncbi:unnamed protein product [Aureobasidium pullulans]|nr:unnamed protein product [Aureobasidium pullulans]